MEETNGKQENMPTMHIVEPMIESPGEESEKPQSFNQYKATLCVCLGAVCAGTALAWTSPVTRQLKLSTLTSATPNADKPRFLLTDQEESLVGAMLPVGALFASFPAGILADKIGRKKTNLLLALPFAINYFLTVVSNSVLMLYIARFFGGLATGAICVTAPMYIGEIADVSIRGTLGSFFQMSICVGILLSNLVGAFVNWIYLSMFLLSLPILFAISFFFMPETPVYLVKSGESAEAEKVLRFFRGKRYNVFNELRAIEMNIEEAERKRAGISDLVKTKGNRRALMSSMGLMFFQQMSGINAVIFYTVPIFQSAGSTLEADVATIIVCVVQVIIAYVAAMIIDKSGRRFFLLLSSIGMMFCLGALGSYYLLQVHNISFTGLGILPLASLVFFIITFALGFGPVPWMIMGELFAPEIKGVASAIAVLFNWSLVTVVTLSFPAMDKAFGGHVTFNVFAAFMAVGTAFVYFVVPETRGKTLQEIQAILNK